MSAHAELVGASIFYMICSAGMSVFNKLAIQSMPLPVTLVCIQMLFTILSIASQPKSVHIGSMRDALRWGLTVPMLFAAMLVSSMVAMEYNTLGTIVVFRNIAPLFTLFIERMFRVPMKNSNETVASLLTIVVGVILYHSKGVAFSAAGLAAICLNMTFAVFERLMQRHLLAQAPVDISKPGMMLLNNAFGLLPCAILMMVYQEPARWTRVRSEMTAAGHALVLVSCLNGLAISYAVRGAPLALCSSPLHVCTIAIAVHHHTASDASCSHGLRPWRASAPMLAGSQSAADGDRHNLHGAYQCQQVRGHCFRHRGPA